MGGCIETHQVFQKLHSEEIEGQLGCEREERCMQIVLIKNVYFGTILSGY